MQGQKKMDSCPDLISASQTLTHWTDPQMLHSCDGMLNKTHTPTVYTQTNSPCCRPNMLPVRETEPAAWRGNRNTGGYSKDAAP